MDASCVLAEDLVEVDEPWAAGEVGQPALGELGHVRRGIRARAQQDVLLHVAPGIALRLDAELRSAAWKPSISFCTEALLASSAKVKDMKVMSAARAGGGAGAAPAGGKRRR